MTLTDDHFRLHAYVDGELTPDEVVAVERALATDPAARAEVAALHAQKRALHAGYDDLLAPHPHGLAGSRRTGSIHGAARGAMPFALAASLLLVAGLGLAVGWVARGHADRPSTLAALPATPAARDVEARLQDFVQVASLSHAVFTPEVRHPVEVTAADEAHLVAWLSKRLAAPLVVPHLGEAGWALLGGRLLPAQSGPAAQFMYQDREGRRLTLAVSRSVTSDASPSAATPQPAFRIVERHGDTVFYWIDTDYAYALTGRLSRGEMTGIADRVYRQLDRRDPEPGRATGVAQ
jgi:anti-sigma factor RsiW